MPTRRRPDTPTPPKPDPAFVTVRELDARVATIVSELKWQRWGMFALAAATISPRLGGPAVPTVTAAVIHYLT